MTATDIITAALRKLNVIAQGQTANGNQVASGLAALNDLIEAWSIDRTTIFTTSSTEYVLTANKQSYTIGKDPANPANLADFNVPRPARVTDAKLIIGGLRYDLDVVEDRQWADRGLQTFNAIPDKLYVDGGYPFETLSLDPAPAEAYTLELWSWQALQSFATPTTKYFFPPGYARALKNNLPLELAPEYEREPRQQLLRLAAESLAAIRNLNIESPVMQVDPAVLGGNGGRRFEGWIGNYSNR